ncbi:TIE1 [Auxenochlorella protothecoides x Auxenochlorella symbiontica]
MAELAPRPQRKGKNRRGPRLNTNQLEVIGTLAEPGLHGLLRDAVVWVCANDDEVHKLDTLCFGNLDGGPGTAAEVSSLIGVELCPGANAVRLGLEEAFFLAHALGILSVHAELPPPSAGEAAPCLDTEALWHRCMQARPDFPVMYLGYHHYRGKGWIPRTGLQYGADYVLYQKHPALAHSDYAVLVVPQFEARGPRLEWHDLQTANRLSAQVSKRLILLFVQCNGALETSSPKCLARFSVQERLMKRWVPESHRPV